MLREHLWRGGCSRFVLLCLLLLPSLPVAAEPSATSSNDLQMQRNCAWSNRAGTWFEAGRCSIEGWQGGRELLLTVRWPKGERTVIETEPGGGAAQIDRRPALFESAADGSWLFRLQRGGALRFKPG